jgi:hypothetical protein
VEIILPRDIVRTKPATLSAFGNVSVPGTRAGAIVSLGLVIIAWIAIPVARLFIVGTCGLGLVFGLALSWMHGRE